jgi:hypothetical protein
VHQIVSDEYYHVLSVAVQIKGFVSIGPLTQITIGYLVAQPAGLTKIIKFVQMTIASIIIIGVVGKRVGGGDGFKLMGERVVI